jgi:hypothetical protein
MLARLRHMAGRDWAVPVQIFLGLSLLAIALALVPHDEPPGHPGFHTGCTLNADCGGGAR